MKKLILGCALAFCLLFTTSAFAITGSDFDGAWVAETVVMNGLELSAKTMNFDMEVTILDTSLGTVVTVKSEAMNQDSRDIFTLEGEVLSLEATARIEYVNETTLHLFIEGDDASTYIILMRDGEPALESLFTVNSDNPPYLSYSTSTMAFAHEIEDRMNALDEKENPTAIDVELCLQYAEMYARLTNLSAIEITAVTKNEPPTLGSYEELVEMIGTIRSFYEKGLKSGDEIISGLVEGIVGE